MNKPLRLLATALLLAPALAPAQTTTTTTTVIGVPPSLQVQRLGPQLVLFAGGQANFDSLVNGLSLGTPVTLITALPNGQQQVVTFTPQGTLTPIQIAQTLETARQSLISRGIAAPTAQQVAITLTGGALPTQTGNVQVTGLLPAVDTTAAAGGTTPSTTVTTPNLNGTLSPSAIIQGQTSAGGTTPPSPAQLIQNQRDGNISNTPSATGTTAGTTPSAASVTAPATAAPVTPATAPAASAPASASIRTR